MQAVRGIAATSVQLDVDAFAEIKLGGPRDVDLKRYRQLIGRDRIVPIYEPLIISPAETVTTPEELVMGIVLNGEARAYPVSQMRSRKIANRPLGNDWPPREEASYCPLLMQEGVRGWLYEPSPHRDDYFYGSVFPFPGGVEGFIYARQRERMCHDFGHVYRSVVYPFQRLSEAG